MAGAQRRKCKCCHKLFRPDPRNRHHQRYCAAPSCRAASKAASQARWLAAPENRRCADIPQLSAWITHYNEVHPHKALGYRSPREFIAARGSS